MTEKERGERKEQRPKPDRNHGEDGGGLVLDHLDEDAIHRHPCERSEQADREQSQKVDNQVPVDPFRQTDPAQGRKHARHHGVDRREQERCPRRFVWKNRAVLRRVMNNVGAVPPIPIDPEGMILDQRAQLIEPRSFVVSRRLIEVGVGRPEEKKQQNLDPMTRRPVPKSPPRGKKPGCSGRRHGGKTISTIGLLLSIKKHEPAAD